MPTFQDAVNTAKRLHEAGRLPEAEQLYLQILGANPKWAEGHAAVSRIFFDTDRLPLAIAAMQTAINCRPADLPSCYNNLGVLLHAAAKYSEAADAFRQALALVPNYAIAHRNLGDALRNLSQLEQAEQSYRQALRLDPKMGDCHVGIGLTFFLRSRLCEAIEQFHLAIKLNPTDPDAYRNMVPACIRMGDQAAVEKYVHRIIELRPDEPEHHSALLMFLNYTHGADLPVVLNESLKYNQRHVLPLAEKLRPHGNDRDPDRPLRIGYISPDFRKHSVAIFLVPVLIHHNRAAFQITCYAQVETPDEVTAGFQTRSDQWRLTVGKSHDEVAEQIRADGIDILIDLAGHSVDNRLQVLARKPAPVQITWLGYPNTTGVSTIDYRLTDWRADPQGTDQYYAEKLIRLPDAFFVYQPPNVDAPVSTLPMLESGHVTFGSFNNIIKITPEVALWWAEILRAIPGARLLIAGVPADAHARLRGMIDGIAEDRIEMVDTMDFQQYLKLHDRVDIALDPYPWAGHTTSCHSLWMGVPVVSLAGPTAVSRAGVSIMANLGMAADWIAHLPEEYIRIAKSWAGRPDDLSALRQSLRDRLLTSPLTDAERFTRNFEQQLRRLWQLKANEPAAAK